MCLICLDVRREMGAIKKSKVDFNEFDQRGADTQNDDESVNISKSMYARPLQQDLLIKKKEEKVTSNTVENEIIRQADDTTTNGITINSNSTIASDVMEIWHDRQISAVCVHLKNGARCSNPGFRGRLSGPALAILEWKEKLLKTTSDGTTYCGS